MANHGSTLQNAAFLMFTGILAIPAGVLGRILASNYLLADLKPNQEIPLSIANNLRMVNTVTEVIVLFGVFILFPLGLYTFINNHISGGH